MIFPEDQWVKTKTQVYFHQIHHLSAGLNISVNFHLPDFPNFAFVNTDYIKGLVWDCSISIANRLEILKSCPISLIHVYDLEEIFSEIHLPRW